MKISYAILYLFVIYSISSCSLLNPPIKNPINEDSIVRWNENRKLSWDDFQGQPIQNSTISTEILIESPAEFKKATLYLPATINVECYMVKNSSWVNQLYKNDQMLLLNQTLFDIYELYARKLRQKFDETNFGIVGPTNVFKSIHQEITIQLGETIKTFRQETEMGRNESKLKEWSDKILNEIKKMDEYKSN